MTNDSTRPPSVDRREPWSRAGWVVLGSLIAVVGALGTVAIQWIVTLHH